MILQTRETNKFKRDVKRAMKRGKDISKLFTVIDLLERQEPLAISYCDHALTGSYTGCRECHIEPDWLLVYEVSIEEGLLILTRTGTHSDLFR